MTGSDVMVRRAERGDTRVLAAVLARAFHDDPIYAWVLPDQARRAGRLIRYMRTLPLTAYGSLGPVGVAELGGEVVGALVQCGPGQTEPGWWASARAFPGMLRAVGPRGVAALSGLDRAVGSIRPDGLHRYLFHLGTDPGWSGHGVGSALLHAALDDSDCEGVPTYLECKPDLVDYYRRFGFEVTRRVPFDAVELWGMLRAPEGDAPTARSSAPRDDSAPLVAALRNFRDGDEQLAALPAHRGAREPLRPSGAPLIGDAAFGVDMGLDKGVDDRVHSAGVQERAEALFAEAVGADRTWFCTGGSTMSVQVALLAALRPGETVVMARNGHKSAFAGLVLAGVRPVYVDPVYDDRWRVAHGVEPAGLDRTLQEHPETRAVMVSSPTYYGVSADLAGLAEVAHRHGVPLLVDNAWGLAHAFGDGLGPNPLVAGADLAVSSVHKSLDALAQTSVLSIRGDRIDPARVDLAFELLHSTSASTLLMASVDATRERFARDGARLIGTTIRRARRLRDALACVPGITVLDERSLLGCGGAEALDPTHLSVDVTGLGLTGFAAADRLRDGSGVHVELADHRRMMALVSVADGDGQLDRLRAAVEKLAADPGPAVPIPDVPPTARLRMPTVALPRDAVLGATEMVGRSDAVGRVCAEMICPYPPGIPVTAPGERLTGEALDYLDDVLAAGGVVQGAVDPTLRRVRVTA